MSRHTGVPDAPDQWFRDQIKRGGGIFDRSSYEMCVRNMSARKKRIALDCGAHVGSWSLPLSAEFDYVHAFEVDPDNFSYLEKNTEGVKNIALWNIALGSCNDPISISKGSQNSGQSHIVFDPRGGVMMRRLDDVIGEDAHARVDFIKLDVEGFELPVLVGAKSIIKLSSPLIMVEMNGLSERYGYKDGDLREYLNSLGYDKIAACNKDFLYGRN